MRHSFNRKTRHDVPIGGYASVGQFCQRKSRQRGGRRLPRRRRQRRLEEEQVRVEDRAFADGDYMPAIDAVETDIIDAYLSGHPSAVDRNSFEGRFLTSP
jgi:hypothetical protein